MSLEYTLYNVNKTTNCCICKWSGSDYKVMAILQNNVNIVTEGGKISLEINTEKAKIMYFASKKTAVIV